MLKNVRSTSLSRTLMGAEIQYFRLEPRYWAPILDRFHDTGLRCVTSYVPWGVHAVGVPDAGYPAGTFDFEGRTDARLNLKRFLEMVTARGLTLNIRPGPFCCNEMPYGGYPSWLALGDPSMMVWDYQNRTTQGYWIARREGSQPSYLHPAYLRLCESWFTAVDSVLEPYHARHGGCISMISLDNEISYIVRDGFLDSDYNPVNTRAGGFYHQFLAQKYGDPHNLPYATRYRRFEEIPPPRRVPEELGDNAAYYLDWVAFKTWVMTEYLRRLRAMHTACGIDDIPCLANFNPHLPEGVPTRMPAFENALGPRGLAGYDFYRGAFMSYSGYHSMARILKLMNASLRYTWSAEFMSGTWNLDLTSASRVSDDHMRFMARCALAQGCKAIAWFMFHDRDCWGDAPVSSHAHPRPSLAVLREVPDLLFRRIRGWDTLKPQTDVAIIYDWASHAHTAVGDPMPCNDNELHIGRPVVDGIAAGLATQEYIALFRLVEQAGIQPGVIDPVHSAGALSSYRLAFLAGTPLLSTATAEALTLFVKRGGSLVLSGPWPRRSEDAQRLRFLGIPPPAGNRPVVTRKIGRGRLIWHRGWLAEKGHDDRPAARLFVSGIIARYLPQPHVRLSIPHPIQWVDWVPTGGQGTIHEDRLLGSAILHRGNKERILFVLNHYPVAVRFTVAFPRNRPRALIDLDTGAKILLQAGGATLDVDRKSGAIFRLID